VKKGLLEPGGTYSFSSAAARGAHFSSFLVNLPVEANLANLKVLAFLFCLPVLDTPVRKYGCTTDFESR
jgi:hypothetical protein